MTSVIALCLISLTAGFLCGILFGVRLSRADVDKADAALENARATYADAQQAGTQARRTQERVTELLANADSALEEARELENDALTLTKDADATLRDIANGVRIFESWEHVKKTDAEGPDADRERLNVSYRGAR